MLNENDNLTSGGHGTSVQFTITLSNRGGVTGTKKDHGEYRSED